MSNPATYFILGMGIHLLFWFSHTLFRKKVIFIIACIIALGLAATVYFIPHVANLQMENGYALNWLYTPALFIITYIIFKLLFKLLFKNEPIMTSPFSFSWEQGEYRRLHLGDSIFTVTTLFVPVVLPIFI